MLLFCQELSMFLNNKLLCGTCGTLMHLKEMDLTSEGW